MIITITLEQEMTFDEALKYMLAGKCLGIRPGSNTGYIELFKPDWMNKEVKEYMLQWNGSGDGIRTNQYLGVWYPVIIDHRDITQNK